MNEYIHENCNGESVYCVENEAFFCHNCKEWIWNENELIQTNSYIPGFDIDVSSNSTHINLIG